MSQPHTFRGSSCWPGIKQAEVTNDFVIAESIAECSNPYRDEPRMGNRVLAVRDSRFKLMMNFGASHDSLFDLQNDPDELHPWPANSEKEIRSQMLAIAHRHISESMKGRNDDFVLSARIHEVQRQWSRPAYRASA